MLIFRPSLFLLILHNLNSLSWFMRRLQPALLSRLLLLITCFFITIGLILWEIENVQRRQLSDALQQSPVFIGRRRSTAIRSQDDDILLTDTASYRRPQQPNLSRPLVNSRLRSNEALGNWRSGNCSKSRLQFDINQLTALTSFDLTDLQSIQDIFNGMSHNFCLQSIYSGSLNGGNAEDPSLAESESCLVRSTQQPLRLSEGALHGFAKAIVFIHRPLDVIVSGFRRDHQTVLGSELLRGELFRQYAAAKAFLWRKHIQYWFQQQHVHGVDVQFIRMEDVVLKPLSTLRTMVAFLGIAESVSFLDYLPCDALPALSQMNAELDESAYRAEMAEHVGKLVSDETRPFECLFGYMECPPDDYSLTALASLQETTNSRLWLSGDRWWLPPRSKRRKIHLITTYFEVDHTERQVELDEALTANLLNPDIDWIHVWIDDPDVKPPTKDGAKMTLIHSTQQATYADLFDYANQYLSGGDHIAVIQNADIAWHPGSIRQLQVLHPGLVFALSRHSNLTEFESTQCPSQDGHNRNLCQQYVGSHDTFAFIPLIDPIIFRRLQFKQNTWGAENIVIEALRHGGWVVENPCMELITLHFHCSGIRKRTGRHIRMNTDGQRKLRTAFRAPPKRLNDICHEQWCTSFADTDFN